MKNKQEQIEEIVKTMCEEYGTAICQHECEIAGGCANLYLSKKLYEASYRKASDVIDDFVERVKERLEEFTKQDYEDGVPYYHADCEQIDNVIDDVADEMRQEVEK